MRVAGGVEEVRIRDRNQRRTTQLDGDGERTCLFIPFPRPPHYSPVRRDDNIPDAHHATASQSLPASQDPYTVSSEAIDNAIHPRAHKWQAMGAEEGSRRACRRGVRGVDGVVRAYGRGDGEMMCSLSRSAEGLEPMGGEAEGVTPVRLEGVRRRRRR